MKNFIQKSLFTLSVISVLFNSGVQAATFSNPMKLSIINPNSSNNEVVIYNNDNTKCLSINWQKRTSSKKLTYASCRKYETDTWIITSVGKLKNKRVGKCLGTPKGEDNMVLVHCNFMHFRDYMARDYIIIDNLFDEDHNGAQIANARD